MFDRTTLEALPQEQLIALVLSLQERVAALEAKPGAGGPPSFVRASVRRKQEKQERKKPSQSFTRKREVPTQVCVHASSHCGDCGRALSGGTEHRRRQVIDIPPVAVQVTDHVIMARWCGVCQKRILPSVDLSPASVDLSPEVLGQHRFGLRQSAGVVKDRLALLYYLGFVI
jgi:transposase